MFVEPVPGGGGVGEWVHGELLPARGAQSGGCRGLYHREGERTHQPTDGGTETRPARSQYFFFLKRHLLVDFAYLN